MGTTFVACEWIKHHYQGVILRYLLSGNMDTDKKYSHLNTLHTRGKKVIAEYVRQGEEAKARILKEAESAADKLEEQAKKNIENEFKQAKETLQAEIVEKALVKAEQAVKEQISADDQERLVDEYLAKVVA